MMSFFLYKVVYFDMQNPNLVISVGRNWKPSIIWKAFCELSRVSELNLKRNKLLQFSSW